MKSSGPLFSNASRNFRQIGKSPATLAWTVAILAIQLVVTLAGGPDRQPANACFEALGLNRAGILHGGLWKIASYGFLHGGWVHAGLNALCLLLIGSRIEYMLGGRVLTRTLLAGVIGGGTVHLLLSPNGPEAPLLVGISGGCMALLLLLVTLSPESRMMPLPVSARSLGLGIMLAELILALLDPALGLPGFSKLGRELAERGMGAWFQMGHACHVGGGLAGWLIGLRVLRPRVSLRRLRQQRERRERGF
jgi:membrane associated rhomboid family serine protease